jgi:HEPN domain-containing protein
MNRTDLQNLAEERLQDAEILLANGRYGAAYYMVGYAVECALKACIAKLTRAEDFYDKTLARGIFHHDLERLVEHARLTSNIAQMRQKDPIFAKNWTDLILWNEESRYEQRTQRDAELLV